MAVHYRHTQVGWAMLLVLAALAALVLPGLPWPEARLALVLVLAVVALVLLLFSSLTVEVDGEAIRLRFGIGLVRKRIPLADVTAWQAVRNPWYSGWGIRLGPRGVLWNVSGFDAVELALPGGRFFRVGTDEPPALVSAITQAKGVGSPPPPADDRPAASRPAIGRVGLLLLLAGVVGVGVLFWRQVKPPVARVGPASFEVETPFYGASFPATDIVAISLERRLPRVLARTNGFAGAGSLRGHFRVEGLGAGRLYVDEGFAPYLLVRLKDGFVVLNFRDPEKTRALYEEMARAWPDRVAAALP